MRFLPELFARNRRWAAAMTAGDREFFSRLCALQAPEFLWIGCADSRVPANEIVGLAPGELFVHRNVANLAPAADVNCQAVVQYAVQALGVKHVIVCGHYGCGGVRSALDGGAAGAVDHWLAPLRALAHRHSDELALLDPAGRWSRLCELNVREQVEDLCGNPVVREAWDQGRPLTLHGWIYDLRDGLLRDLEVSRSGGHHRAPPGS